MTDRDGTDSSSETIDTSRDGRLHQNDLRYLPRDAGAITVTREPTATREGGDPASHEQYQKRQTHNPAWSNEIAFDSYSAEETDEYLRRLGNTVFVDSNPKIIRRTYSHRQQQHEQRVFVRYLQPPPLPTSEPLIVKEVHAEQPPPPPAVIIRQHGATVAQPPPLILRERPPLPPTRVPSQTVIRHIVPTARRPRSLIIEYVPGSAEESGDVVVEVWLPQTAEKEQNKNQQAALL